MRQEEGFKEKSPEVDWERAYRRYLRENYNRLKYDMEKFLNVLNDEIEDKIDKNEVLKVYPNIQESSQAIIEELQKGIN